MTRPWRLQLLGGALLAGAGGPIRPDRRAVATLAYLALEGPQPRARLAALLWPDSTDAQARANLRQVLRRLRTWAGGELVEGGEELRLAAEAAVDVVAYEAHLRAQQHAEALALHGELLRGLSFEDCEAFEVWLGATRERLEAGRQRAVEGELERLLAAGAVEDAFTLAEAELARTPLLEAAYRRLMRLHYQRGSSDAALALYQRCVRALREHADLEPSAETRELAREVERAARLPAAARRKEGARQALPLSVLRPPVLVGREREWERMEEAWEARRSIVLLGEPGAGKTRLALDFAASKGRYAMVWARPGDPAIPYSTYARHIGPALAARGAGVLPAWARAELGRVLPDLAEAGLAPSADPLRFLQALSLGLRVCSDDIESLVSDDIHWMDTATIEVGAFLTGESGPERTRFRFIDCARKGELQPAMAETFRHAQEAGLADIIEVEPLAAGAVAQLLQSLDLPGATALAPELTRYTGGNPLFITETLKHLLEAGGLEKGWPERLQTQDKVRALITRRLAQLSPPALQLAQVAALAATAFDLELAAEVLEVPRARLGAAVGELEAAQVLRGQAFTHDLVQEAVRGTLSPAHAALVHRRLGRLLQLRGAAPAAVAHHWLEGGEPEAAVPALLAAAEVDAAALRPEEAAEVRARVARILEDAGRHDEARRVRGSTSPLPAPRGGG